MCIYLNLLATVLCGFSYIQSMNTMKMLKIATQEQQNISPQEQFFNAAQDKDLAAMQQLLITYPDTIDINAINATTGYTAFIQAAYNAAPSVMQFLLDHGCNLQAQICEQEENIPEYYFLFMFDEFLPYVDQLDNKQKLIQCEGKELLSFAVRWGALNHVKKLIQYGVNPSEFTKNGFTALHSAAENNEFTIMHYFVEECNINPVILSLEKSRSPLHSAAYNGNREVLDYLSDRVPAEHIYACEAEYGTVLHNVIAGSGLMTLVDHIATKYPKLLTIRNMKNDSPLALAVGLNRESTVRLLIKKYKLNVLEDNTPLFLMAVQRGYFNLVKYFTEEVQLDPLQEWEIEEKKWPSAFHYAASSGRLDILKYFIEERGINQASKQVTTNQTILDIAVSGGYYPEMLDYLINQRAFNVNVPASTNGKTPLYYAAVHGILPCVKALIGKYKASVDQPTNTLFTPLMAAVFYNRLPVVRFLLKVAKANPQLKDKDGNTIVHFASRHMSILNYLLNEHYPAIDINAVDNGGNTPLHHHVSTNGTIVALRKLLQAGANSRLPNNNDVLPRDYTTDTTTRSILHKFGKYTPRLFQAYDKKSRVKLQYLALNITFNIQDAYGDTLLHKAIRDNNTDMITFLLTINREVAGIKNKHGETPVTMALLHHRPIFDLLLKIAYIAKLDAATNSRKRSRDTMESASILQ